LPSAFAKESNTSVLDRIDCSEADWLAIESIASYGMAVGAEIFETCVWAGRFIQQWYVRTPLPDGQDTVLRVYRRDVKLHLCGSSRATDANIRQALIDLYGPSKATAVGLKATPGPLYGISADVWAALGVAVTVEAQLASDATAGYAGTLPN
jgi:hypothetical protein